MGLFNLFGGKKKDDAPPAKAAAPPKPEAKSFAGKTVAAVAEVPVAPTAGVAQVKLRLKLVQSLRSRRAAAAYEAAKELAAIQAKAGRRLSARMWTAEAERIKAGLPQRTAA